MTIHSPQISYFTCTDGYRCAVRRWTAEMPMAEVVLVHGIISHGGWYTACGSALAARGMNVHLLDRRGSGLNLADRGDVERYETWLDDVAGYVRGLTSDRPRFLLGISWGGKFAAAFARQYPTLIAGVGMLCPGLFARQMPSRLQYLALRVACAWGQASRRVTIPLNDPSLFTNMPDAQEYIRTDPLTLRKVSLRFALADNQFNRLATRAPEQIRVPGLLVLAGRDRIVDNAQCRSFFAHWGHADHTLREFPSAAHTIEFEPDPGAYFQSIGDWIVARSVS